MDSTGTQNGMSEGVRTGVRFSAGPQKSLEKFVFGLALTVSSAIH
jgi:hypothetical protein